MRIRMCCSVEIALCASCCVAAWALQGAGVGKRGAPAGPQASGYRLSKAPVPRRSARTWIRLRETMVSPATDGAPFADVMSRLRKAMRDPRGTATEITFYISPGALLERSVSSNTPVPRPSSTKPTMSVHEYLTLILRPFRLEHHVHNGVVVVDTPCDDCPPYADVELAEARTWMVLHEEIPLHFPGPTPLGRVLGRVEEAASGKMPTGARFRLRVDDAGLRASRCTLESTVSYSCDNVPLCTSLYLMLREMGLCFWVAGDGVVTVTGIARPGEGVLMDEADAIEAYQILGYALFWIEHRGGRKP